VKVPEAVIREAFALSRARGAELLTRLGDFDVWRGDLSEMRGDSPRSAPGGTAQDHSAERTHFLFDTLAMARAIEKLRPLCRDTLSAVYEHPKDTANLSRELETHEGDADEIATNCEKRLVEIYAALKDGSADDPLTTPDWITEREHAAAAGDRRRR
jgi:hypothetical protein